MASRIDPQITSTWWKDLPRDFLRWLADNFSAAQDLDGRIFRGAGSPNNNITAPIGSLYLRSDGGAGTTLYVKESGSGNTGWVGK